MNPDLVLVRTGMEDLAEVLSVSGFDRLLGKHVEGHTGHAVRAIFNDFWKVLNEEAKGPEYHAKIPTHETMGSDHSDDQTARLGRSVRTLVHLHVLQPKEPL